MKKYTMAQFISETVAVVFSDYWELMEFLHWCENCGLLWKDGSRAKEFRPEVGDAIAYGFCEDGRLGKSEPSYYLGEGWKVVKFSDFEEG